MTNWTNPYWEEMLLKQGDIKKQHLIYATPVNDFNHNNKTLLGSVMLTNDEKILVSYFDKNASTDSAILKVVEEAKEYLEPLSILGIEHYEITDANTFNTIFHVRLKASIAQQEEMQKHFGFNVNREDFGCIVSYDGLQDSYYLVPFSSDKENYTVFYKSEFERNEWFDGNISSQFKNELLEQCKSVMDQIIAVKKEPHRYYLRECSPMEENSFPVLDNNKVLGIRDFDGCYFQKDVGEWLYGYVEYKDPLMPELAREYDLCYREPAVIGNDGQEYRIRFGYFGNGLSVMNQYEVFPENAKEVRDGIIAHISNEGEVHLYRKNIPEEIISQIHKEAQKLKDKQHIAVHKPEFLSQIKMAEFKKTEYETSLERNKTAIER